MAADLLYISRAAEVVHQVPEGAAPLASALLLSQVAATPPKHWY